MPVRTRIKTDTRIGHRRYDDPYWDRYNYEWPAHASGYETMTSYEKMLDFIPHTRVNGRYPPSDVQHTSFIASIPDVSGQTLFESSDLSTYPIHYIEYPVPFNSGVVAHLVPSVIEPSFLSQLSREAFINFSTQVPTDISIANFSWELREWKDLIPSLEGGLKKVLTGQFLNFEFGWLPLKSDLQSLSAIASRVAARIAFLKRTRGKTIHLNYYKKIDVSSIPFNDIDFGAFPDVAPWEYWRATNIDYSMDFRASCRLYQNLVDLDSMDATVHGFIAALGLNNLSKVFWQALPFSFVVDWFLKLGSQLDSLAIQPFHGEWRLSEPCVSIKEHAAWTVSQSVQYPFIPKVGLITMERYYRWNGFPIIVNDLRWNDLSPMQQALGLSLIGQVF